MLKQAFIDKYTQLLGAEEGREFLESLTAGEVEQGYRLNLAKPEAERVHEDIMGQPPAAPYAEAAYLGAVSGKRPLHQAGYVYSQEPSAMIVATAAAAQPGERVLDLCAAPGGKSTQLAAQLQGKGLLLANEIMPKRAKILSENIERWGASNVIVTQASPSELVPYFERFFDKIVVDAPCSGEGMFRKDEGAVDQWEADYPSQCASLQREILASAMAMLKVGGHLVYSTCTFAPEEDEAIVSWLLEQYPLSLEPIDLTGLPGADRVSHGRSDWGDADGLEQTIRLWPHRQAGEGHFVARLRLEDDFPSPGHEVKPQLNQSQRQSPRGQKPRRGDTMDRQQQALWQDFQERFPLAWTGEASAGALHLQGDHLWWRPAALALDLSGLKVLRQGLHLGTFRKKRFEPSYALALATGLDHGQWPQLALNDEDWRTYMSGQTLSIPGDQGWVLLTLDSMPIAWGRQVKGTVKNFFPKGLRF